MPFGSKYALVSLLLLFCKRREMDVLMLLLLLFKRSRSGIVEDKVGHLLCRNLCSIGWAVSRISVVRNDIDYVAEEVERWKGTSDTVFIYGGVGPLHSDVTVSRVAKAFGVRTEFSTKNKLLITGTPLENSVKELWMNINWSEIEIAFMGKLFILLQ